MSPSRWGSPLWSPRTLPVSGDWYSDGPLLPIEFARQSRDGRITLVVTPGSPSIPVLWAELDVSDLQAAKVALADREGIPEHYIEDWVGWWSPHGDSGHLGTAPIAQWAAERGLTAVIWTALPVGFRDSRSVVPSLERVLAYLESLTGDQRARAEEYVRKAPVQTRTPFREALERELGWEPLHR